MSEAFYFWYNTDTVFVIVSRKFGRLTTTLSALTILKFQLALD